MKSNLIKVINTLLIIDIGIVIFTYLSKNINWFINTQIGFITSSLVVIATFISYSNMVNRRVEAGEVINLDRDTIDKIEDPYSLYGEDNKDIDKKLDDEKKSHKQKKLSVKDALKNSKASISIYRLLAYTTLIAGFLFLNKTSQLEIIPYIFAISLPPIIIIISLARRLNS